MKAMLAVAVAASVGGAVAFAQQWTPPTPKNLQVLPKDTPPRAVVATMRSFAQGLGVRCQYCHVFKGTNPDDLATFDFASDEKEHKKTARVMLSMVMGINEHLASVGDPAPAGELKVTCYTCHRGEEHPLTKRPEPAAKP
jgi:Photosynthetic reaction centre cytochrome C subunit